MVLRGTQKAQHVQFQILVGRLEIKIGADQPLVIDADQGAVVLLAYAIGISGEMHDEETLEIFGISPGLDLALPETRGAIVLALIDPVTGRVLWRASASGAAANDGATGPKLQARIERAVRAILDRIPRR